MPRYVKWRWALNGALIGFVIAWADLFLEWRDVRLADWSGTGIAYNLGHIAGAAFLCGLIGFLAGLARDVVRRADLARGTTSLSDAKRSTWKPLAIAAALAVVIAGGRFVVDLYRDAQPGLWGNTKRDFVEGLVDGCERTQLQLPENKGFGEARIRQYCQCFADGLAEQLTKNDLKAAYAGSPGEQRAYLWSRHPQLLQGVGYKCGSIALK